MGRSPFYSQPMSAEVRTRITAEQRDYFDAGVELLNRREQKLAASEGRSPRSIGLSGLVRHALDYLYQHDPDFRALTSKKRKKSKR